MDKDQNRMGEKISIRLRDPGPGDIGWVVHRHGVLYAQEQGWNVHFEALVARVAADFLQAHDPLRERCWIAECDGRIAGSVFLMRGDDNDARLRLLYLEPFARGTGLGRRLVETCMQYARDAGYRSISLWTTDALDRARQLYIATGFELVHEEAFDAFGPPMHAQTWRYVF